MKFILGRYLEEIWLKEKHTPRSPSRNTTPRVVTDVSEIFEMNIC